MNSLDTIKDIFDMSLIDDMKFVAPPVHTLLDCFFLFLFSYSFRLCLLQSTLFYVRRFIFYILYQF